MSSLFRRVVILFLLAGGSALAAGSPDAAVSVADLLDAKVDYAADYTLTSGNGIFRGSVIHAPGRERREFGTAEGRQILLLRRDTDEASMLWPDRHWYLSTRFSALAALVGGVDGLTVERRAAGQETVGGERTTRYEVGAGGKGGLFQGAIWLTADGILMKAAGHVTFAGRDTPVDLGLANLRRVKADPAAFVRPADYKGLPLDFAALGIVHQ